ncbi:hypothetical protein [Belnapia moabensis]|uniref:hypothetical protein n=1 Tax=Belnapia moabensis TaxID=365533 RepID=UPI0005B8835B|nr:hypothetical protein [Belnapia moabensis]
MAKQDEEKYARGIHAINDSYGALYRSLSLPRSDLRRSVHALRRGFLINKGFTQLQSAPMYFWCVTFDFYNRGSPNDPNGPRRLIAILRNWPGAQTPSGQTIHSSDGGYFAHLIYSNNHYGDQRSRTPSFAYVKNWPLKDYPAGAYSALGSVAATFG